MCVKLLPNRLSMLPTQYRTIYATSLLLTVCFALTPVQNALAGDPTAEQNRATDPSSTQVLLSPGDTQVLEDLVVSRKRVSAEVVYESDDTMTVNSADDFDAYKALSSGAGAAVNFNIAFAVDSIIMTASGRSAVEQMANALRYFSRDTRFELLVHEPDDAESSRGQRLVQGRINELVRKLKRQSGVEPERLRVVYTKQNKPDVPKTVRKAETLPLTLVNMG